MTTIKFSYYDTVLVRVMNIKFVYLESLRIDIRGKRKFKRRHGFLVIFNYLPNIYT